MKILYAVQATGNGHLSRALELGPALERYAEVDYLLSGSQGDIDLNRPVRYRRYGASFLFGQDGGIDLIRTVAAARPLQLLKDIRKIPVTDYDLVVNDFEPITAWACRSTPSKIISVSHQAAFYSDQTPRPARKSRVAEQLLRTFAPSNQYIGLHFDSYDTHIMTPIVRDDIRSLPTDRQDYVTVYLPAYADEHLVHIFSQLPEIAWRIFSKHTDGTIRRRANVTIYPVGHKDWHRSFAEAEGVLLGSGFESPSEALCIGKKLLTIPMRNQYEQQCNAEALRRIGVEVLPELELAAIGTIRRWLRHGSVIHRQYPAHTEQIVAKIMAATGITPHTAQGGTYLIPY